MRPVTRSRTIEVPLNVQLAGSKFAFPDQPDLRAATIEGVETYTETNALNAISGRAVVSPADALLLTVTLSDASDERVLDVPYLAFNTLLNSGQVRTYKDLQLTWEQCTINAFGVISSAATSALITIHYRLPIDDQ